MWRLVGDPCPAASWQDCTELDYDTAQRIRDAIDAYFFFGSMDQRCHDARSAMLAVVDNAGNGNLWLFDSHSADGPGGFVAGEVIGGFLVGFNGPITWNSLSSLGRIGIHEGAHLMGWGEPVAEELENACLVLS
jgi:hypothetical protein